MGLLSLDKILLIIIKILAVSLSSVYPGKCDDVGRMGSFLSLILFHMHFLLFKK